MATKTWTMNRHNFLRLTGKTLAVSAGALSGCATMSAGGGSSTARAIDIHHHYFPPELITEIKQHGKTLGIEYFAPKSEKEKPAFYQVCRRQPSQSGPAVGRDRQET